MQIETNVDRNPMNTFLLGTIHQPAHDQKSQAIKIECYLTIIPNLVFAFLIVAGEVGQYVSLPLWIGSTHLPPSGSHLKDTNEI